MTKKVITVTPDTPASDIARLLIENGISALPVVNTDGEVIGMVSEGDLIGRSEMQRLERRDWWLNLLAEGEQLAPEFLANIQAQRKTAHDIMSSPVITVTPTTEISEIAHLLTEYHIKRVPVVSNNSIIGIVSRADLVRAFAILSEIEKRFKQDENFLAQAFISLEQKYRASLHKPSKAQEIKTEIPPNTQPVHPDAKLTVKDFQTLVANFEHAKTAEQEETHHKIMEQHKQQVTQLVNHHIDDANWHDLLHHAREAAQQGAKEFMLLRFPNELCSDGGRAINVNEQGWPKTLRGEAAEIYLRWEQDLRPQGFRLTARILEYPGGFPGDIGLFLVWGY